MDFSPEQGITITKSVIELIDPSGSCGFVEKRSRRSSRFGDGEVVFYDNGRRDLRNSHSRPLYVTTSLKVVKLKLAMLDQGFYSISSPCWS